MPTTCSNMSTEIPSTGIDACLKNKVMPESYNNVIDELKEISPSPKKILKQTNKLSKKQKAELLTSPDYRKTLSEINKNNKLNNIDEALEVIKNISTDNCGFCLKGYYDVGSSKDGNWIQCQICKIWFHEKCVGTKGCANFVCGRCS